MEIELVPVGLTPTLPRKRIGITIEKHGTTRCIIRLCDVDTGTFLPSGIIAEINAAKGLRLGSYINPAYGLPLDDKGRINLWE